MLIHPEISECVSNFSNLIQILDDYQRPPKIQP